MKHLLIIVIILCITCCKTTKNNTIEGDLYFKLIDFQHFEGVSDKQSKKIKTWVKTADKDALNKTDKELYTFLKFMVDKQLFEKPFVRLRLDNGEIILLFLEVDDYKKVKDYNYVDLVSANKKVRITAEVKEISDGSLTVYKTLKPISIDKMDGKTHWKK